MQYEPVIGLEVHAQLQTKSKMFCRCPAEYAGAEPNSHTCPICAGYPGVLPVINEEAVELALRVGLALSCEIAPVSRFDRKHYPYPDLPKGYQISQYNLPLAQHGHVRLNGGRRVGIVRVHMEEDTGRLVHRRSHRGQVYSLVDLNRSGVPLLEIVSAPDLGSATEAREYVAKLRQVLQYIDANSGNMEEGALRVDANVSVRPKGSVQLGAKVEIKNMNSFRAVERALDYEIRRQVAQVSAGETVDQETRGWDEAAGVTLSQRTKEYEHDYRYFPEPDLPPVTMAPDRVERTRSQMAELPDARRERFIREYCLSADTATALTARRETADYFEGASAAAKPPVTPRGAANWIVNTLFGYLQRDGADITGTRATPEALVEVVAMVESQEISAASGRAVLDELHRVGGSPRSIVQERGLVQISDDGFLTSVVENVIQNNPQAVGDFRAGKQQAIGFLVGQVMKETKGRARADSVRAMLLERLAEA